jgi:GT2 family glycosyltransferase/tetratricopeptide (TPR) repeat protein
LSEIREVLSKRCPHLAGPADPGVSLLNQAPPSADTTNMSTRPAASIVILAWNAWKETQACLESLRPTLGLRDQVIVVDNGSRDATRARLKLFSWVEVVSNRENRGFARGCNQGAALARNDIIVFLNNDTVLTGHWLDALVAPFDDPLVGATGPRSNFVPGPQVADGASYLAADWVAMRRFARTWERDHRDEVSDTDRLVDFCLAVRRSAFDEIGGFDEAYEAGGIEDDDLCHRLLSSGRRLRIAHGSYVHHSGHRTVDFNHVDWYAQRERNRLRFEQKFGAEARRPFPLVSACLIVKDEEQNLPSCLTSLEGFADEVIVYDTGSVDGTVALARAAGATVIEGYWDDDFSRARNQALAACQGEWIAWLDADETLMCEDTDGLRELLRRTGPDRDAYSVVIENITGSGAGAMFVHTACRLFRRARCEWAGRLHEQVAGRGNHRPVDTVALDVARIHHTGYTSAAMHDRGKAERNLRVAEAEVANADGWDRGFSLTSLGRAYMTAGRAESALAACQQGAAETDNPITRRLALRTVVDALVALGRNEEALEALDTLRTVSDRQVLVVLLESNIRRQMGQHQEALDLLATITGPQFDDDGFEYEASMFAQQRSESLAALGRYSEAADELLDVLVEKSILDTHLGTLIDYLEQSDRSLGVLADAIPSDHTRTFLAQVLQLQTDVADRVLEAFFQRGGPEVVAFLATAATLARKLQVERALVWSSRLRFCGLENACPLVYQAADTYRSPVERARAAAVGSRMFADPRFTDIFPAIMRVANQEEQVSIVAETSQLCPAMLSVADASS